MRAPIAIGLAGCVIAAAIWLAISVRGSSDPAEPAPASPSPSRTEVQSPTASAAPLSSAKRASPVDAAPNEPASPLALEQRRAAQLLERAGDLDLVGELLGAPPSGGLLAKLENQRSMLQATASAIEVEVREGKLSADEAISKLRAAEDTFRQNVQRAAGLGDAEVERLFR